MLARIERILRGISIVSLLLFSRMSYTTRLWVYGVQFVVGIVMLTVFHVVPWVRRRGWRRQTPWPWTMPDREYDDSHAFWGY